MPALAEISEMEAASSSPSPQGEAGLERILIVRLGSMGDIVHTLPAVATLRSRFPQATLGWVIEERWSELLSAPGFGGHRGPARPLVDLVLSVHSREWRDSFFARRTRHEFFGFVRTLRAGGWRLAIDFQSAIRSAVAARISGAGEVAGFADAHEAPASLLYTRSVEARGAHMVEQNISLTLAVAPDAAPDFTFPLPRDPKCEAWAAELLARAGGCELCVVTPGAGWGAKRWPPERFASVARSLRELGLLSIVNFGPGEEALAAAVEDAAGGAALAERCSIGQLIALLRRARLCVGGDTGPTHLAAALGVPVAAIYGPTNPARNGPFGAPCIALRSPESITDHSRRSEPEAGLLSISAEQVVMAAHRLLGRS